MVIMVLFDDIFTTEINLIIILQQKWGWYLTIIAFLDILHCCGMHKMRQVVPVVA